MEASAILVLLVLPGAIAGPVQWQAGNNMCATYCPESSKYRYETGLSYEYSYEAETRTTMGGAAEDTAKVTLTATALVEVLGHCEMALRLTDVAIKRSHEQTPSRMVGADDMSRARRALEGKPLRFAFHDGAVAELCPDDDEDVWALNVKRGVLTSFQNSMRQLDREEHMTEADVTGNCPTHYKMTQQGWKTLKVSKVKDMLSCTDRNGYRTSLLSAPYHAPNSLQSLPLMKSSHECEHDVSANDAILQRSSCQEVHVFRPFSKATSGAVTEASQTLTFRRHSAGTSTATGPIGRRTTLVYEHKLGMITGESTLNDVKNKLQEICEVTKLDIRPQVPHIFGDLVHLMRTLDYSDLQDLDKQLTKKRLCSDNAEKTRKFFQDALPMAATGASLRMMNDFLTSGEVKDAQATFWLTSLAFLPNPTKDMVAAVQPLLANAKTRDDAALSVSSLVNNYCQTSPHCGQDQEVQGVLDTLTATLDNDCSVTDDNFNQVLLTLRAIGNIGQSEAASLRLQPCFTKSDLPMDVRVAALDAYRRMPCSADRNNVMEIFRRHSEDSELRIAAYLAVMKCPSDTVLSQVRQALMDEEVNQVGSFVWTHLTNLLETESPHKQAIRDVLESELLQREFSKDRRKFSRNYELSFFSEKFNLGGIYENNIIWSPSSFVPRSAMLNLTVDMFGHSVNLLEVGGRVQGLEYLLDTYFGPSSEESGKEGGYGRTDVVKNEKMARTKNRFGEVKDDLRAQLYLRVFGNELVYRTLDGSDVKKLREGKARSFFDDLLERLMKDGQVALTQSAMFMDTTLVIPTALGLPLNLTVNGSASVELQASQKIDFKKFNAKSKAFEIAADIQPSGAVEFSSMMSVDAFVTQVGLKMTSRLHSSTALKGRMELARGQIFSVEIDTPRETLELFDFQSKFYIVHDAYEKEQQMVTANRKEKKACTGSALAKVVGLELCASLAFPNATLDLDAPYFPFTGPTHVTLSLHKHDIHSGYRLFAKQIQTSNSIISQLALDTPGSKVDRAVSLGYVANIKDKSLEADLLSPWKKVSLKASLDNSKKTYKAVGEVTVDADKQYKVQAQVDRDIRDRKLLVVKIKPSLLVTSPQGPVLSVGGALDYREGKQLKTSLQVEMEDVLKKPITLDYALTMRSRQDKMRYKNNLKLSSQFATVKMTTQALVGSFSNNKRSALLTVRSRADYNLHILPKVKRNIVNMGLKLHDRSTNAIRKYGVNLNFDSKQTPDANLLVNGEVSHKKTLTELEVKVRHGKNIKARSDPNKELLLAGFVAHNIKDPQATVRFDFKAVYPDKDMEYQVKGKHEHDKKSVEDYFTLRYAKGKSVDAHLRLEQSKKKRSATFDLSYPEGKTYPARDIKINADLMEKSSTHHVFSALAALQKGEKNSLVVSFRRPTATSVDISSEMGLHDRLPIKLDLSGNYALRNMRGQGELTVEGKTYSLEYTSDIQPDLYAKFTLDAVHPQRRVKGLLEGGKDTEEGVKRGKVEVLWDANNDPSQMAGVTMEMADTVTKDDVNVGGMVEVVTPVKDYQQLKAELRFENSRRRILTVAETVLGDKQKEYSAKFLLKHPVSKDHFNAVAWLKTPFRVLQHAEVSAEHSFDPSGSLSTSLKGVLNRDFLDVGLSGSSKGDLVVRILEGSAFFKSSIPGAENYRLSFNHRDSNGRYTTQSVLNANGDQYSAGMDADFTKVHWQVSTSGTVTVRAPQLTSPTKLIWTHSNNLHELTSSVALNFENNQEVQFEVGGKANIVSNIYDGRMKLRGPWKENRAEHVSQLTFHYEETQREGYDFSTRLELDRDSYVLKHFKKRSSGSHETSTRVRMSRFPEYSFLLTSSLRYENFPYVLSTELQVAEEPLLNVDVEVENPSSDVYRSNSRVAMYLDRSMETVAINARHEKNGRNQWVTKGDVHYELGHTVAFESLLDYEGKQKLVKLTLDSPYDEMRNLEFQYSHTGNVLKDFSAAASLAVQPHFDTVSAKLSYNNRDVLKGSLRVDTPFDELRYMEVSGQSYKKDSKRHSSITLDYSPRQVYRLETVYAFDFPDVVDMTFNLTTPHRELPSLYTEFSFQGTEDEVTGKFKLIGPVTNFQEVSTNFGHRRTSSSVSTRLDAVTSPGKTWSGRADVNWDNEVAGTLSITNSDPGPQPFELAISHRGHTWNDFRTKAGFKMNGDRLESELGYSDKDGHSVVFMLATPDPDLRYFRTTFFKRLTDSNFEMKYTAQYGEESKPFEFGLTADYPQCRLGFSTDVKTPHSENLAIEFGLGRCNGAEVKLLGVYGANNKINTVLKYQIEKEVCEVVAEFEYLIQGSGRNVGLALKREGPLENLRCQATGKYMGKEVSVDTQYRDADKKTGRMDVRTNFKGYRELAASFDHSGDSTAFQTDLYLKYMDNKEAKGTVDFSRNRWRRVALTTTFKLPLAEYEDNKLTYKHNYRRNKFTADANLKLGLARPVQGEVEFVDNSKLTVSVTGPYKDFESFTASGTFDEADLRFEGDSTLRLLSQPVPITSRYTVRAGIWPVMVNVQTQTPYDGWRNVELSTTHDGGLKDFTTSSTLTAEAVGTMTSETVWTYSSPLVFDGKWTLSSSLAGAEDLKLFVKNTKAGDQYQTRLILGWELLKELVLETSLQIGDDFASDERFKAGVALTTPFSEASQVSLSFDHSRNDRRIQDAVVTRYNDKTYLDADFSYTVDERRVGRLEFREPRPMEFLIGGRHTPTTTEGELMLNWDKRIPEMNVHLSGDYTDRTDRLGTDKIMKMWVVHPARTLGFEYLLKQAAKEFQTDFLLTWNKASGQTLSYIVNWTDRSSRFSSAYDAKVKVGVPMRSVQVEGMYSNTGRAQAAEGSLMWDADRDKNMKVGVKGQLDNRGKANKVQLGLDLPFVDKEFSLMTEAAVNSGNTLLDSRTEFSYSVDPRKLLVVTTRVDDLSYGTSATNYSLEFGVIHPMTDVNIQLTSHVGDSQTLSSMASKVVYLTSQREKQMVEIRGKIDKLRRLMDIELKSPSKTVGLEGQMTPSLQDQRSGDTNYNIRLAAKEDGQKKKVTDIFVNPKTKTFELTYRYDEERPKNSLNLFGVLMGDNVLQADVYRMDQGQRISEGLVTLRLNSSHVLHTRLNWRPSMLRDLQQYLSTQLTVYSYASSETFQRVAQAVGRELEAKYLIIMQEVREEAAPLLQQLQREMGQVQSQLNTVQRDMRRFYQSNALHVQDMGQVVSDTLDNLVTGMQYVVLEYSKMYTQFQQDIDQAMRELGKYPMAQKYAQLVSDFASGLKNSRVVLEQALDELSGQVSHFSDVTYRKYLVISRQIDRKLEGYTAALRQTPQYQGLAQAYSSARSGLMQLSQGQYKELADAAHKRLMTALEQLGVKDTYVRMVSKGKQLIADQFQDIVQRPEFQQIYVIGNEMYQQSVWAYHYWHVEKNAQLAVGQVLELAKDIALLEITRVKNAVVDLDKSRVIVFDPQNGELQFEIYLPVPLKSLTEPPDMRLTKYVNRVKSWAATYIPSPRHSIWTSINNYLPNMDTDTWIAPYPAYAYVMGDQHVVTFDRKHYSFAGRCSYILARDMADDRFTVVLNYNNRPRQPQVESLVVMLRGVAIEVDRNNKVRVNNQATELPFFSGLISAVRKHNVVMIQDGQALTVEMDSERGIYSVAVSGWYHGRTAGLLGIYDNEPYNDLTDSLGQLTSDVEALSNSWEVSRRYCRSRNLAEDRLLDRGLEEVQACEKHLNHSSSYYSPCFGQVEAGELVGVCVEYVRAGHSVREAQCMAGQQYRYMCHRRGVALGTPKECVSCELPGGQRLSAGDSLLLNTSQIKTGSSADVVFIVEESDCNSWAQRSLATLATELGQALTTQGLTANRFGLVSYSGNGSSELQLMHTIEGEVFGDPGNFLKATENLRLTYPSQPGNVGSALREALKYPYRVGVAKLLVLLPCSNCTGDLLEVTQVLISHGFRLHVLKAQDFRVTDTGNHSPVRIFGMDLSRVHTQRSAARNSDAIFRKLEKPRDACAQLALSTNGSVFDVSHMSERGRIQSEFLESFAGRGANNAQPPPCQACSCFDDGNGRGHTVCRLCDNHNWLWNHIPTWLQSGTTSVMGVFNDLHHQIISSIQIPNAEASVAA